MKQYEIVEFICMCQIKLRSAANGNNGDSLEFVWRVATLHSQSQSHTMHISSPMDVPFVRSLHIKSQKSLSKRESRFSLLFRFISIVAIVFNASRSFAFILFVKQIELIQSIRNVKCKNYERKRIHTLPIVFALNRCEYYCYYI